MIICRSLNVVLAWCVRVHTETSLGATIKLLRRVSLVLFRFGPAVDRLLRRGIFQKISHMLWLYFPLFEDSCMLYSTALGRNSRSWVSLEGLHPPH